MPPLKSIPVLLFLLQCYFSLIFATAHHDYWDLAVVTNDQIELLTSNGTLLGTPERQFTKLKALTFDSSRQRFIVSDMDQRNDSILSVNLNNKETDINAIVEDLPDDVLGLAYDPFKDVLYWTDSLQKSINYVSLKDPYYTIWTLFNFTVANPQDITIDVCNDILYWTNSNVRKPTIERSRLDGSHHEVLVSAGLHKPSGITIDRRTQRLYWADIKEGIYFTIESMDLTDRSQRVDFQGTHCIPFGLAVDASAIYFTDVNNNALWRLSRTEPSRADKIRVFPDEPMGLVAHTALVATASDCHYYEGLKEVAEEEVTVAATLPPSVPVVCLNNGNAMEGGRCECPAGFTGHFCELSLCHNYCLHGNCYLTEEGQPRCNCRHGYRGNRCEEWGDECDRFCSHRGDDVIITDDGEIVCRCVGGVAVYNLTEALPLVESRLRQQHPTPIEHFQDPAFLVMAVSMLLMLISIIALAAMAFKKRAKCKPKIRKRIIVNKNVTPLTYRPQQGSASRDQCEITIENCCNMNVCDTPCFEPPVVKLPSSFENHEDKKQLLANMEQGEELY